MLRSIALAAVIALSACGPRGGSIVADPSATNSPWPSITASATGSPSPTTSGSPASEAFEDRGLGYRITLPGDYRQTRYIPQPGGELLGRDHYTAVTEQAEPELGAALARAFAARDVAAVATLMPACRLNVYPLFNGEPPGGVLHRSVARFTEGLRERFAAGDLTVTVDPDPQGSIQDCWDTCYVISHWREGDRTTRIDLYFNPGSGRWLWNTAEIHYNAQADFSSGIMCRQPWGDSHGWCDRR